MDEKTARTFTTHSAANAAIVEAHCPTGSCRAYENAFTYKRWKVQGFQVRKGEHGAQITTWITRTNDDNEVTGRFPKTSTVFCSCQVDATDEIKPVLKKAIKKAAPTVPQVEPNIRMSNPDLDLSKAYRGVSKLQTPPAMRKKYGGKNEAGGRKATFTQSPAYRRSGTNPGVSGITINAKVHLPQSPALAKGDGLDYWQLPVEEGPEVDTFTCPTCKAEVTGLTVEGVCLDCQYKTDSLEGNDPIQEKPYADNTSAMDTIAAIAEANGITPEQLSNLVLSHKQEATRIQSPADIAAVMLPRLGSLEREELHVVLLNTRNEIADIVQVYRGSLNSAVVRMGELFTEAIRTNAAAIIMCHNHPSGDPTPSPEDIALTSSAVAAGKLLDIEVLDHMIVGNHRFVSLKAQRMGF